MPTTEYQVIVIGGGHAGAEAAWAAANMGARVAMLTMDVNRIGQMSCNPAIGGLAKGQIVREIDAMGGLMGLAIDATGIQFRILNQSKGPAVRGPRAQADKYAYAREVQRLLHTRQNLDILPAVVEEILVEEGRCVGVEMKDPSTGQIQTLRSPTVILTTGTFMRGLMHRGESKTPGGRIDEPAAEGISGNLQRLGFELGRLKTGTPPRLAAETIALDKLIVQDGDQNPIPFSDRSHIGCDALVDPAIRDAAATLPTLKQFPLIEQKPCWVTQTNEAVHDLIRENLDRAPMYNGQIETAGPRYCPSIEDKVVRFADKPSHTIFLEPESLETNEIYCNGISTSLPQDIQDQIIRNIHGCENARVLKYGYAVEYDMVPAHQIDATCMTKQIEGLFLAGQINGTTGYEEAACQGLIAGINAVHFIRQDAPFRLRRDQAYIGVLMDDLVTKIPREPYRMFTSRAEHRLLLRADNAAERLTPVAQELGLIEPYHAKLFEQRQASITAINHYLQHHRFEGTSLYDLARRPEMDEAALLSYLPGDDLPAGARDLRAVAAVLSEIKYAPFVERHAREQKRLAKMESLALPANIDYASVTGLRNEAISVLNKFRPATYGQAARLAGINPADMTVLSFAIDKR